MMFFGKKKQKQVIKPIIQEKRFRINLSLNDYEKEIIISASKKAYMKPSTFVKTAVMKMIHNKLFVSPEISMKVIGEINAIGNNINQTLRYIHTKKDIEQKEILMLLDQLHTIQSKLDEYLGVNDGN